MKLGVWPILKCSHALLPVLAKKKKKWDANLCTIIGILYLPEVLPP